MTKTALAEMTNLQERLVADAPGIGVRLTTFPSGGAMLDVRRSGRAFVMAYHPRCGFGVDELEPDEGFRSGYRFVFNDFATAARQLLTMAAEDGAFKLSPPTLNLIVIQSADVQTAREFYSQLGLSFMEEQHGNGPRHIAAVLGALVLEIYPCQPGKIAAPLRLGFQVPSLDQTLESLRSRGARIVREPQDSAWGRRAVVEDPDGNRVELSMRAP